MADARSLKYALPVVKAFSAFPVRGRENGCPTPTHTFSVANALYAAPALSMICLSDRTSSSKSLSVGVSRATTSAITHLLSIYPAQHLRHLPLTLAAPIERRIGPRRFVERKTVGRCSPSRRWLRRICRFRTSCPIRG